MRAKDFAAQNWITISERAVKTARHVAGIIPSTREDDLNIA
jgi:hypothetical protein